MTGLSSILNYEWANNNASDADLRHGGSDMLVEYYEFRRNEDKKIPENTDPKYKKNDEPPYKK